MNNTVSNDFLRQRRAVYHGLCGVLPEDEAGKALAVWMERFNLSGSVFSGLNSFVRELCTQYGRPELQRDMLMSINRALMAREEELRPAPSLDLDLDAAIAIPVSKASPPAPSTATQIEVGSDTPEFQTFQFFLLELLDQIDLLHPASGMDFRDFIREVVMHSPWSEAQQEQLIQVVAQGKTIQTRSYRAGQLKTLMTHLRAWLIDHLGDSVCATLLAQALANTNTSAPGLAYSARNFL